MYFFFIYPTFLEESRFFINIPTLTLSSLSIYFCPLSMYAYLFFLIQTTFYMTSAFNILLFPKCFSTPHVSYSCSVSFLCISIISV